MNNSITYYPEIQKIADNYGYDMQSRQCIEEMAELTQAINKYWRKILNCGNTPIINGYLPKVSSTYDNLVEEIADVEICLAQMKYLLAIREEDVDKVIEKKIDREMERMRANDAKMH